jgi:hypothetical protein
MDKRSRRAKLARREKQEAGMRTSFALIALTVAALLGACAGTAGGGLNTVAKSNQLLPGMSIAEVKTLLGSPSQTQFVSERMVWKYSLHEYWKGWVPYYLVFSSEPPALERWYADEGEYQRQQAMWLQALRPSQQTPQQVARDKPTAAGGGSSSSSAALEACKRKYPVYEDRMCYCYSACSR